MIRTSRVAGRFAALVLAVAAAVAANGCGGGNATGGTTSGAPGDGGVLRFALETAPSTLDPSQMVEKASLIVTQQVAEGLFEVEKNGQTVPDLASDVKTAPDGRTMTIDLRRGVTFSNGKPMTSKDVVFSLEQARKSPFNGSLYSSISAVEAPSSGTVVLKLKSAAPALVSALANYSAYIVPDNFGGLSEKEFGQAPIGTGPYAVASGQRGGDIELIPNSHYWKQTKPHFDEIVFTVATDENSRLQQLRSGDLDMSSATLIGTTTGLPPGSGVRIDETQQKIVNYLLLNQNYPLFKDPRVREAVNLAVDREGIIKTATDGKGQLGASFLPPSQTFFDNAQPPARDVAKAKQLVAEATTDGVDAEFTLRFYDFDGYSKLATQIIQQDMEEIGIDVKLQPLDEAALNELIAAGEYEAVVGIYLPSITDPVGLSTLYLSFFAPKSGQDAAALTQVADEAAVELNEERRNQLYVRLQEMMIEEEGLLVLNYQPEVYPAAEMVTGIEFDGVGDVLLRNAGFSR